jgi:hypothetical protein
MSNYTKTTNFGAKDTLPSGDSQKIIRGTEFDTEFNNIATAVATKLEVDSSGNLLIGTATGFTTTSVPGGCVFSGYGIYPYTSYESSTPSGVTNTTIRSSVNSLANVSFDGSSSLEHQSILVRPTLSATGTGGSNQSSLRGVVSSPRITFAAASSRVFLQGGLFSAIRTSSTDSSTNASNAQQGLFAVAGVDGSVGSGASSAEITGAGCSVFSGSGSTTNISGFSARLETSTVSTDQNTTITNASLFIGSAITLGRASGPTTSITNLYGTNIGGPNIRATATVTNYYAFFAAAPTITGTLTNRWGIYISDASSPNYFAGSVQVGSGTASAPTLTTIADTNTGVFFPAADVVGVSTGGTERARVKSTGQLRFVPLASDPAGAETGDVYYNSTDNKLKVYNGTSWVDLH